MIWADDEGPRFPAPPGAGRTRRHEGQDPHVQDFEKRRYGAGRASVRNYLREREIRAKRIELADAAIARARRGS